MTRRMKPDEVKKQEQIIRRLAKKGYKQTAIYNELKRQGLGGRKTVTLAKIRDVLGIEAKPDRYKYTPRKYLDFVDCMDYARTKEESLVYDYFKEAIRNWQKKYNHVIEYEMYKRVGNEWERKTEVFIITENKLSSVRNIMQIARKMFEESLKKTDAGSPGIMDTLERDEEKGFSYKKGSLRYRCTIIRKD